METKAESNRQTLARICYWSRIAGWATILSGILRACVMAYSLNSSGVINGWRYWNYVTHAASDSIVLGLLVLGMVQLIRYVVEEGTEPKWLLRKGHLILSLFALFFLVLGILNVLPLLGQLWTSILHPSAEQTLIHFAKKTTYLVFGVFSSLLPPVAKALCVLGMAALLRAVLPIVAESKTLA
jgi:hypothetical protein